jgi:hypothetical protein
LKINCASHGDNAAFTTAMISSIVTRPLPSRSPGQPSHCAAARCAASTSPATANTRANFCIESPPEKCRWRSMADAILSAKSPLLHHRGRQGHRGGLKGPDSAVYLSALRPMPPNRHILSFAEYAAIRHPTPYVVDLARGDARLVVFGGRHSSDPADPMFEQIDAAFAALAPAFALHEGTPPAVELDREIAIRRHGEAGLVRRLAARAGIETASMDIPLPNEARLLGRELSRSEALVYLVVRQLASFNRKTARMDYDGYFSDFFASSDRRSSSRSTGRSSNASTRASSAVRWRRAR